MHATPGEIKSFRSSALRMADIANVWRAAESLGCDPDWLADRPVGAKCHGYSGYCSAVGYV